MLALEFKVSPATVLCGRVGEHHVGQFFVQLDGDLSAVSKVRGISNPHDDISAVPDAETPPDQLIGTNQPLFLIIDVKPGFYAFKVFVFSTGSFSRV